ncbi:MAG: hypothetical protein IEMM0008_0087 [bacterium]|nr:MAG: hypothetical protein IEMM0008_0087 [bacterium]
MNALSLSVQDILNYIDTKSLSETEYVQLVDELIERDPNFIDILNRLVDETSTRISELKNLRPEAVIIRDLKITTFIHSEYVDKGLDELKKQMIVQTAEGEWLDLHGGEEGLYRKTLEKATGKILIGSSIQPDTTYTVPELITIGTKGSVDQEPIRFFGLTAPTADPSTPVDSGGDYTIELDIQAELGGSAGNLDPGLITEVISKVPYFDLVKQIEPTGGGFDRESDEAFRSRILEKKKTNTEYSITWFKSQAESFAGVLEALIIPAIHGEGTVGVIIRGTGTVIPQSVIDAVQAHFDSPSIRPLANWKAFVYPIATKEVTIVVDVYYRIGFPVLESDLQNAVNTYFSNLSIGDPYIKNMMETEVGQAANMYNFTTLLPVEDIVMSPDSSTLMVLASATFNLIEVT